MDAVFRRYVRNIAFLQRDRLLAVWRYNKRAFKHIDVLIPIMGMPPTFGSRHNVRNIDDRFFANDVREVRPM